jgi:hypothetical protein
MTQNSKSRINVEAIGLAAVVLSLILVALELRQNTIALEGQAVLDLNAAMSDLLDLFVEYPEIEAVHVRMLTEPDAAQDLSAEELIALAVYVNKVTSAMEAAWVFHDLGLIDDEQLATYKHGFCKLMNSRGHKDRIDNNHQAFRKQFLADFVTYCENRTEGINW